MGYTTEFYGSVKVSPPLNEHEISYLRKFSESRRMNRANGPYYTGTGFRGQDREADVTDYNRPPTGQPGLWCQWVPTDDGTAIEWDGGEKFYEADKWMGYLIDTFLKPGATVAGEIMTPDGMQVYSADANIVFPEELRHFTFDHTVNGVIEAQGEDSDDRWRLCVTNNVVSVQSGHWTWDEEDS